MLKIVTKVLVVKDFGVRGQRTDRGANAAGIHGIGIGRALSIREATLVRQRSLFLACFKLVDMARQDEGHRHFSPIALPNRDGSIAGHKVVEELSTENVCKKKSPFKTFWVKSLPVFGCDASRSIHGLERWARLFC